MTFFAASVVKPRAAAASSRQTSLAVLVGLLVLRLALLSLGLPLSDALLAVSGTPFRAEWLALSGNFTVVAVDLGTLAVVARLLAAEGSSLRKMFGRLRARDVPLGLFVALILFAGLFVGAFVGNWAAYGAAPPQIAFDPEFRIPVWFGLWCLIVLPATVAIAEEALYRGFLQPRWTERIGTIPGVLLVAASFGLQHLPFALSSPRSMGVKVFTTFVGGLVLAIFALKLKRLWPLVIGHWIVDVIGLGLMPFLAAIGH